MTHGKIGVDGADAKILVPQRAPAAMTRAADDLMLRIRLVKRPAELLLMRGASAANVQAALAAARAARDEGSVWRVRQRFYREAAARGSECLHEPSWRFDSVLASSTFFGWLAAEPTDARNAPPSAGELRMTYIKLGHC